MAGGGDWIDTECGGYPSAKAQGPFQAGGPGDFRMKFFDTLQHLREEGSFCDITLKAGDTVIKCHKALIVAASPYFRCLLTPKIEKTPLDERLEFPVVRRRGKNLCDISLQAGNVGIKVHKPVTEPLSPNCFETSLSIDIPPEGSTISESEFVELKDISGTVLKNIIDFIYTGDLFLTSETISTVLHTSSYFEITPAVDICKAYIKENLKVTNFLNFLSLADSYNLDIIDVAASHFSVFVCKAKDSFLNLDYRFFQAILATDKLSDISEEVLCKLVLHWVYHDLASRSRYLSSLLDEIRLCLLPYEMLVQLLKIDMIKEDEKAMFLIMEAQGYREVEILQPLQHSHLTDFRTKAANLTIFDSHEIEWQLPVNDLEWLEAENIATRCTPADKKTIEGCVVFNNFLFVACCDHHDKEIALHRYDPRFRKWLQLSSLEEHRECFTLEASGRYLYILGGISKKKKPRRSYVVYSIAQDRWSAKEPMPFPFALHASTTHSGDIYCSGGFHAESNTKTSKLMYKLDPISSQWTQKKSLWCGRSRHSMVTIGDHLYVVGGVALQMPYGPDRMSTHNVIEYYDTKLDQWTSCAPSMIGYSHVTACGIQNAIYITGICQLGHEEDEDGRSLCDQAVIFKFDPIKETLTKLCSFATSIDDCEEQELYKLSCYSLDYGPQPSFRYFVDEAWAEELFGLKSYGLMAFTGLSLN